MNTFLENKIDITVLVTSISQREITIETVNYYSEICNEVIFVDEESPHLSANDIDLLKKRGITYIPYKFDSHKKTHNSPYEKRLIAANHSNNTYLVHSNHDERYTYHGLLACVSELEDDNKLAFCIGQAIAVRKDNSDIYYSRSYKNLCEYENFNEVNQRLYHHAEIYVPLAHYSVWRKESYITTTKKTIKTHNLIPSTTMMEEVIFELAADLAGNSKAISELFWIRNRINPPTHNSKEKGAIVFKIIEKKLYSLFDDSENIQMDIIINSFWNHFTFVRPSFLSRSIILIKRIARKIIKKEKINDIDALLKNNKITYKKNDLSNVLKSMGL